MEEKVYYKDENAKVTDLRITANHVTVPIEQIKVVKIDFKAMTMTLAITIFLSSLIAVPVGCYFYGQFCWLGILLVIAALIWLRIVYKTYTELKVATGARTIKLLEASMGNREYIYRIAEALEDVFREKWEKEN